MNMNTGVGIAWGGDGGCWVEGDKGGKVGRTVITKKQKSQVGYMSSVLPDVIFQEKQKIDILLRKVQDFSIFAIYSDFFQNLSVGHIWLSGYQYATTSDTEWLLLPLQKKATPPHGMEL